MIKMFLAFIGIAMTSLPAFAVSDKQKLDARLNSATGVIEEIMGVPDKAIPTEITEEEPDAREVVAVLRVAERRRSLNRATSAHRNMHGPLSRRNTRLGGC